MNLEKIFKEFERKKYACEFHQNFLGPNSYYEIQIWRPDGKGYTVTPAVGSLQELEEMIIWEEKRVEAKKK